VVIAACPLDGASGVSTAASVVGVLGSMVLWVLLGVLLGGLLQVYLCIPPLGVILNLVKPMLVVGTGGLSYYWLIQLNGWITANAPALLVMVRVDPLLVCMIAAIWANHVSKRRDGFREILHDLAPLVMPPFFTVAGATLDLQAIMKNAAAPPVLFGLRFIGIATGSFLGAMVTRQTSTVRNHLWMTLQAQSGVTLGLVAQMKMGLVGKQPWAEGAAATIIGCVVMNQLVGPTLCRFGIRLAGESNEDELEKSGLHPAIMQEAESGRTVAAMDRRETAHSPILKEESITKRRRASTRRPTTGSILTDLGEVQELTEVQRTKSAVSFLLPEVESIIVGPDEYESMDDESTLEEPTEESVRP